MRRMTAICRKELQAYFFSPIAYVAFAFYFVLSGLLFSGDFLSSYVVDARPIVGTMSFLLIFIVPLLSMRLISEELNRGTDELLLTSPASLTEIVFGKYLAAMILQLILVVGSLIYPLILSAFGKLDQPVLWLSYLSMFLLGCAMMAVGLFASSLTSHQMIAGIIGFALLLVLWVFDYLGSILPKIKDYVSLFAIASRTSNLQKGVLDIPDVVFYITLTAVFVVLSIQVLGRKRWR